MSTHTPGPWLVTRGAQSDAYSVESGSQTICLVKFIRGQSLSERGVRQEEANAHLIAAAPDLLTACKAVVEEDGFRGSALMRKRIDAMRDAIAKAEAQQ